jgi:hypothetical protein
MKKTSLFALGAFALGFAACGGSGTGTNESTALLSCDFSNFNNMGYHTCVEVLDGNVPALADPSAGCTSKGGTVVSSCPTAGQIGKCTENVTTGSATGTGVWFYYSGGIVTQATGKSACDAMNGTSINGSAFTTSWTDLP